MFGFGYINTGVKYAGEACTGDYVGGGDGECKVDSDDKSKKWIGKCVCIRPMSVEIKFEDDLIRFGLSGKT